MKLILIILIVFNLAFPFKSLEGNDSSAHIIINPSLANNTSLSLNPILSVCEMISDTLLKTQAMIREVEKEWIQEVESNPYAFHDAVEYHKTIDRLEKRYDAVYSHFIEHCLNWIDEIKK